MLYGLTGSSGVGKTTLARRIGDTIGIPFIPSSVTEMAKSCGYNAIGNLSLGDRLDLQRKMLSLFVTRLKNIEGHAILDRTPIDMLAYMMTEVSMWSGKKATIEDLAKISEYVDLCQKATWRLFRRVIIVSPLPFYENANTRPEYNPAYQRHCGLLIEGALAESKSPISYTRLLITDLEERVTLVSTEIAEDIKMMTKKREECKVFH